MRFALSLLALAGPLVAVPALAQQPSLTALSKQYNCVAAPIIVEGTDLYKCQTGSGMSYFSGPPSGNTSTVTTPKKSNAAPVAKGAAPSSFPRVESSVQRERDDVRKRVLTEELATEVSMMVQSEVAMKNAALPLPDETLTSPKYLERQAKLRATTENHSRNIQALNKELERIR